MFKWGTTQMNVKKGSYQAPFPVLTIHEIGIIPSGIDAPASIIQSGGRARKKAKMVIIVPTLAEYQAFYNDYLVSQERTAELKDGVVLASAIISSLSTPYENDPWLECEIEFMEV